MDAPGAEDHDRAQRSTGWVWHTVALWAVLRVWTSLWAAIVSPLRPLTALEQAVPLWPPTAPWALWLQRVLLAPWERWDVLWYLRILTEGYRFGNGTDAFHPLYPWLAWPLTRFGVNPLLALMIVGNLGALGFLLFFEYLAELDIGRSQAQTATRLLLFFPLAFIFFAPYNEGLFMLLTALTFLWARQRRWWRAGMAGALAVLTRQQGLFLGVPLVVELWAAAEGDVRRLLRDWKAWTALILLPLGLLMWVLYRVLVIGGAQLDWTSPVTLGYSMLVSPSADQVGAAHVFTWPWRAFALALARFWAAPDVDLLLNLVLGLLFLGAAIVAWPRLRLAYRAYVLVTVGISFSYHTGMAHPYMGLPRHLWLAFPVFIGLGGQLKHKWQQLLLTALGFAGLCFLILVYVLETWVP